MYNMHIYIYIYQPDLTWLLWLSRCEPDFQVLFGDQRHLGGSGELTAGSWKKTYKNQKLAIFFGVSRLRYVLCFFFFGNQLIEIWWSWIYVYIYIYILWLPYRFIEVRWLWKSTDSKTQDVKNNGRRLNIKETHVSNIIFQCGCYHKVR